MGATLLIARSRLRRNLMATVLLILLAGLGTGVVMASVAAARRADRGWATFQERNPNGDAVFGILTNDFALQPLAEQDYASEVSVIGGLPGVTQAARLASVLVATRRAGTDDPLDGLVAILHLDPPAPGTSPQSIVVAGRRADPRVPDEVVIDEEEAQRIHVGVGDRIEIVPFTAEQFSEFERSSATLAPEGEPSIVTVVGIQRYAIDMLGPRAKGALYTDDATVELSPAWWDVHDHDVASYGAAVAVDLDDGPAGLDRFTAQVADAFGERAIAAPGLEFEIGIPPEARTAIGNRISAEARAVIVFAIVTAAVAAIVVGQALFRQLRAEADDEPTLRSLGLGRQALVTAGFVRSGTITAGASLVAVGVALVASMGLPTGVGGRVVEGDGVQADLPVLVVGVLVLAVLVLALSALGTLRSRGDADRSPAARPTLADRSIALGLSTNATLGLRMAFDRSSAGRSGRAAVGATALAVGCLVAAAGLLGSYHDFADTPDNVGQVWDASTGNFASPEGAERGIGQVESIDGVEAIAGEISTTVELEGRGVTAMAYVPAVGELHPRVFRGRSPASPSEVMLGEAIAGDLGVDLGDEVDLQLPQSDERLPPFQVVGIGVAGSALIDTAPGSSVLVDASVLEGDINAEVAQVLLVRFAHDADRDAVYAAIHDEFPDSTLPAPILPRAVQTVGDLSGLPLLLAGIVGVLATGVVANALVGSVRRRRGELAVLKALGCDRGAVARVVAWQATGWGVVAVVLGLPLGLLLSSVGWRAVQRSLGVHAPTVIPWVLAGTSAVAVLILLNLVAALPARSAAQIPAAEALRSE